MQRQKSILNCLYYKIFTCENFLYILTIKRYSNLFKHFFFFEINFFLVMFSLSHNLILLKCLIFILFGTFRKQTWRKFIDLRFLVYFESHHSSKWHFRFDIGISKKNTTREIVFNMFNLLCRFGSKRRKALIGWIRNNMIYYTFYIIEIL